MPAVCAATQKKPAGHGACVWLAVVPDAQKKPGKQGKDVGVVRPAPLLRQKPAVHAVHAPEPAAMAVGDTVCETLTVIVQVAAAHAAPAVMVVPGVKPEPVMVMPAVRGPAVRAVIVSVVPAIAPVPAAA